MPTFHDSDWRRLDAAMGKIHRLHDDRKDFVRGFGESLAGLIPALRFSIKTLAPQDRVEDWYARNPAPNAVARLAYILSRPEELPVFERMARPDGDGPVRLSDLMGRREWLRSEMHRKCLPDVQDLLSCRIGRNGAPALILNYVGERRFRDRDVELLRRLTPHLAQACANQDRYDLARRMIPDADAGAGQALVRLSARGAITFATSAARRLLGEFLPELPAGREMTLPPRWRQSLRAGAPTSFSIRGKNGRLRVCRLPGLQRSEMVLRLDVERPAHGQPVVGRSALTAREGEVLDWIAVGKTNPETARLLGVSPRTVEKHVERVLVKLGVETRHAAALLVFEGRDRGV